MFSLVIVLALILDKGSQVRSDSVGWHFMKRFHYPSPLNCSKLSFFFISILFTIEITSFFVFPYPIFESIFKLWRLQPIFLPALQSRLKTFLPNWHSSNLGQRQTNSSSSLSKYLSYYSPRVRAQ